MEGDSLVVQGFGLHGFTAWGPGTIPGQGAKILQAYMVWAKKKKILYGDLKSVDHLARQSQPHCHEAFSDK